MARLLILAITAFLSACGGGGGGGGNSEPLEIDGIYEGTSASGGATSVIFAMVSKTGDARILDLTNLALGTATLDVGADRFAGQIRFYDGLSPMTGNLTGAGTSQLEINGQVNRGGTISNFNLAYIAGEYERPANLSRLAGTYVTLDGVSSSITIFSDGTYTGQTSTGCSLSGSVSIPDAARSLYNVIHAENCGGTVFSASGLAHQDSAGDVIAAVSNSTVAGLFILEKQ